MKKNWFVAGISTTLVLLFFLAFLTGCGGNSGADDGGENKSEAGAESQTKVGLGNTDKIDSCNIVTQADATELFGQPANKDEGAPVIDPNMLGECLWSYDTEVSSQLIQFRVWADEMYYGPTSDSEEFDIGDKGSIRVNEFAGVDIEWVQDGKTVSLSYFTTGSNVPDATSKVKR